MSKATAILRNLQLRQAHKQAVAAAAAAAAEAAPAPAPVAQTRPRPQNDRRVEDRNQHPSANRSGNQNHGPSRGQTPAPGKVGRIVRQQFSHGRTKAVLVVTPSESFAPTVYTSKFVPSRNGGVMAAIKDAQGRVIFPDRSGPQPKNDGQGYSFYLVGPNAKGSVNFAYVLVGKPEIKILPSGKIVCTNRKAPKLVASGKALKSLPKNRQGRPTDSFVREEDDFDWWQYEMATGEHEPGCDGVDCECDSVTDDNDGESLFWQTVEEIEQCLDGRSHDRPSVHSMDATYYGDNDYGMPTHTKTWA